MSVAHHALQTLTDVAWGWENEFTSGLEMNRLASISSSWLKAAVAMRAAWPDASKHLVHYLGNTGETIMLDVPRMEADAASLKGVVASALIQVKNHISDADLPIGKHYTFTTASMEGDIFSPDEGNWKNAVGSYYYWVTGWASRECYGNKSVYAGSVKFYIYDYYNFDEEDSPLRKLHQVGLAREFSMRGHSTKVLKWSDKGPMP